MKHYRQFETDTLEELGVVISLQAAAIEKCIEGAGIAFMFAPVFHPAMKNIVPVRKALGVRTVFNILGPLLNPAGCRRPHLPQAGGIRPPPPPLSFASCERKTAFALATCSRTPASASAIF